jgi:hypothetical protein
LVLCIDTTVAAPKTAVATRIPTSGTRNLFAEFFFFFICFFISSPIGSLWNPGAQEWVISANA